MKEIDLEIKPPSVNRSYGVSSKGGKAYMYSTKQLERFQEQLGWKLKQSDNINTASPITAPIHLKITYGFKAQHRSKEDLKGLPYRDVDDPSKPMLDALEGLLIEDDTQIQKLVQEKEVSDEPFITIAYEVIDA